MENKTRGKTGVDWVVRISVLVVATLGIAAMRQAKPESEQVNKRTTEKENFDRKEMNCKNRNDCSSNKHSMNNTGVNSDSLYFVRKLKKPLKIDGNWEKEAWREIPPVRITNFMGTIPAFQPVVEAKMLYDDSDLYVIFRVEDRYVRSLVQQYNGPVSHDACVEFFVSPDTSLPDHYFNLETNAGGTPLLCHHVFLQKEYQKFTDADLDQLEIAHSLPRTVDPEITEPVVWTLEYRLPVRLLEKYGSVVRPGPGVTWRANFYKIASQGSNPHYITWAKVENEIPNFHLPRFFGRLQFQ